MAIWNRFVAIFRPSKVEEIEEELRYHVEMREQANLSDGMSPENARSDARRRFGNPTLLKERTRDIDLLVLLDSVIQDLRFAVRTLAKSRVVTGVAVLTLALGIGANTAIFSLLNALALRDLAVPHPEQLARLGVHAPGDTFSGLSLPMFEDFASRQNVFSAMFAWWGDAVLNVETDGELSRADIWAVTGNFQSELGAVPAIGRVLMPDDVNLKAAPVQVAVLGHDFWIQHYGGSRDVLGKTIKLEGIPFTIVGVTRSGFTGFDAEMEPAVTVPLTAEPLFFGSPGDVQKKLSRRQSLWIDAAGRLKPGVTLSQARAQLESLWPEVRKEMAPADGSGSSLERFLQLQLKVEAGSKGGSLLRGDFLKPLYLLLGISGALLLLTCINIATLMLARAASRSQEIGVRLALGAGRIRVARQMLTESIVLSVAGALAGFAVALWASHALTAFIAGQVFIVPARLNLSPDWRVLGFTTAAAILAALLFGAAPAWRAMHGDAGATMERSARTVAVGTGGLGRALITAQVALSIVLLAGAGLFIRSIRQLHAVDPGFRTHGALMVSLFPKPRGYDKLAWTDYYRRMLARIQALPGVASVGLVHTRPGNFFEWTEKVRLSKAAGPGMQTDLEMLTPGAFKALGIRLLRGRGFTWQDDDRASRVAIVGRSLAQKICPSGNPIGQRLDILSNENWHDLEIVGVVTDASLYDLRKRPSTLYVPGMQYGDYMGYSDLIVHTRVAPVTLRNPIRQVVNSFGHEYVASMSTIEAGLDGSLYRERTIAMLSGFFGGLGLLLAAIGLYGLMSFNVTRRSREIAIRIAVGSPLSTVRRMVLREALVLAAIGIGIGVPCSLACGKLISGMLFGVSSHDPLTIGMVSLMLLGVAAVAAVAPARTATRLDPIHALRSE